VTTPSERSRDRQPTRAGRGLDPQTTWSGQRSRHAVVWEGVCFRRLLRPRRCRTCLKHAIQATGSSTYNGAGYKKKEGDSGIRPDPPRSAGDYFPILVIEAGNSESLRLLHKDKDSWFNNSPPGQPRGDVRIVVLVKVERRRQHILVEQWYRGQQSPSHTVIIMPHTDKPIALYDASHWIVESAPMVIPFEDVFLRLPTRPRETNLVLTEQFFTNLGMQCWQSHTKVSDA